MPKLEWLAFDMVAEMRRPAEGETPCGLFKHGLLRTSLSFHSLLGQPLDNRAMVMVTEALDAGRPVRITIEEISEREAEEAQQEHNRLQQLIQAEFDEYCEDRCAKGIKK